MKPITAHEVLPVTVYERARTILRPLCMAEKDRRRLAVGDHLTLLFENRRTVWYQIEEVLRVERIFEDAQINHEIATYNELLPKPGELSATMLIEYSDDAERDAELKRLVGLERHLWIVIDRQRVAARFDEGQTSTREISSVQFIAFPLGGIVDADRFAELAAAGRITIEADHPHLAAKATVNGALGAALAVDLQPD